MGKMNEKKRIVQAGLLLLLLLAALGLSGCGTAAAEPGQSAAPGAQGQKPPLPEKLELNAQGVPLLRVYQVDEEAVQEMNVEDYLLGVLAGEMKNDWPLEALKAQAILARTFVLKFCTEKQSRYAGADISTDIEEAQAYDATGVNERIERAVQETRGLVLASGGEFPYAWFHAHSGGMTAEAKEGLAYEKDEPAYTRVTEGREGESAPQEAKSWQAEFTRTEFLQAAKKAGLTGADGVESVAVGERGKSGRAVTLNVNGQAVSAPELRIALGSSKMRSTLLTSLRLEGDRVVMAGKGYGHGVGMPQWGAFALAEEGKAAQEIVTYYFQNVTVEKLW